MNPHPARNDSSRVSKYRRYGRIMVDGYCRTGTVSGLRYIGVKITMIVVNGILRPAHWSYGIRITVISPPAESQTERGIRAEAKDRRGIRTDGQCTGNSQEEAGTVAGGGGVRYCID